jgi:hypothetical protein
MGLALVATLDTYDFNYIIFELLNFRFFEIEPTWDADEEVVTGFTYTKLRNDKTYVTVYTLWFRLIATAVVPFCLMLFCNVGIIFYYRKNRYDNLLTRWRCLTFIFEPTGPGRGPF